MMNIPHIPDIEYEAALLLFAQRDIDMRRFLQATGFDAVRFNYTIENLMQNGYLKQSDEQLILTDKGNRYYKYLNRRLGRKGLYGFMIPDYSVRKVKKSKFEIYIPKYMIREYKHFSSSYVLGRSGESSGDSESLFKPNK